jgi:hypothetical protein
VPSGGELIAARLVLDGQRQFSSGAKQASKDVAGIGKSAEESGKLTKASGKSSALGMLKTAAAAGATYKAMGLLKDSVSQTTALAKSTKSLQRVTGLDAKSAQNWSVMTQQRGIDTAVLGKSMGSLSRQIGGLGGPTKQTDAALKGLGLSSAELAKLPMDQQMAKIADGFKAMPDGANKAALAQKLFGRAGQQLLPILNSGSKGLNENLAAAQKLVPPLGDSGKAALDLAKKQRELQMASTGVKVAIGSALLPIISSLATTLVPLITTFASWMGHSKALTYAVMGLAAALIGLLVLSKISAAMTVLTQTTIAHKVASLASSAATKAWAAAQWLLNAAMTANPIVLVIAAIVALIAILVVAYMKIGWFRDAVNSAVGGIVSAFNWLKGGAAAVFDWIKGNWPLLLGILTGPFGLAVGMIITHFDKIKAAAKTVVDTVKSIFGTIPAVIKSIFSGNVFASNIGREIADWLNANTPFGDEIKVGPASVHLPALATGGTMLKGGTALVGEQGPELVTLPAGASVIPLTASSSMAATITVPVYLDRRQIALATGSWYSDQAARQGEVA